ncbi:MAG TPA: hypothetical protein VFC09_08400 [Candidatus Dormibacteraeota bacterium]|nr:hypothetical protein [Candidatus Dormibacteraeota bacterium]
MPDFGAFDAIALPTAHTPQPGPSPVEMPSTPVEQPQPPTVPQPPSPPVENPVDPGVPGDLPRTVPDLPEEAPEKA